MFCQEYDLTTWLAYLEKRLSPDRLKAMEKHLETCSGCLAELLEINRSHARMMSLSPQPLPQPTLVDHFTLAFHQTKEAVETLLGKLSPLPLPVTRTNACSLWQYTSHTLGITLTISYEKDSFNLSIEGNLSALSLSRDKMIFQGEAENHLSLTNLSPGTYTLTNEKGTLTFTISLSYPPTN